VYSETSTPTWIPDSLQFNGNWNFFAEVQRPGLEGNHSPSARAEVENEWSCTYAPPLCLDVLDRGNSFTVRRNRENWSAKIFVLLQLWMLWGWSVSPCACLL